MLSRSFHARCRARLADRVPDPVLLLGNGLRARNMPANPLPFRQDSNFLYFTGCGVPGAAALLHEGRCTLFLPEPPPGDALWHGPAPSLEAFRDHYGVDAVRPTRALEDALAGLQPHVLAVADEERNRLATQLTDVPLRYGVHAGSDVLVNAVIELRRTKAPEELEAMRQATAHSAAAHLAVMRASRPGVHERTLNALFEAVLRARGCEPAYGTILTQRGEILHNHAHDQQLAEGRLLLLDGGGEVASGYAADITRTWPTNGRFSGRQRAVYQAVLAAQDAALELCRPGVRFRSVHDAASRVLARFLADEGLLRVSSEEAVERGAHALFFPHGVGHLIGLDVHDLEAFGDRAGYPKGVPRPTAFGTCNLRLDLPLQVDWIVTVEPGFYVVPSILDDPELRARFSDAIDWDVAEGWVGFGGCRLEDDVRVAPEGPERFSEGLPRSVDELEAVVASGTPADELLN